MKKLFIFLILIISINLFSSDNFFKNFMNNANNFNIFNKYKLNGTKESFYEDGQLKSKEFYIDNRKAGKWQYFYRNGKIKMEILFNIASNNGDGFVETYDEEGLKISEGRIRNDEKIETWKYFDERGGLLYTYNYTTGIITSYDSNGKILLRVHETDLAKRLNDIEMEILNDRIKLIEEKNR